MHWLSMRQTCQGWAVGTRCIHRFKDLDFSHFWSQPQAPKSHKLFANFNLGFCLFCSFQCLIQAFFLHLPHSKRPGNWWAGITAPHWQRLMHITVVPQVLSPHVLSCQCVPLSCHGLAFETITSLQQQLPFLVCTMPGAVQPLRVCLHRSESRSCPMHPFLHVFPSMIVSPLEGFSMDALEPQSPTRLWTTPGNHLRSASLASCWVCSGFGGEV